MSALVPARRPMTAKETAALQGVSVRTVRRHMAEPRAEFLARTQARRAETLALRDQGKSWAEIAEHFGISALTARQVGFQARKALAAETNGN